MNSAIYSGTVRHARLAPVPHEFDYSLFMMYLDLDEVPALFAKRWLWSNRRLAPAWFRRADYLGDAGRPLKDCVVDLVEERLGRRPDTVRLLTHLRYFGYCLNPVSFYYCYEADALAAIVAEVTNTPWSERHLYVVGPELRYGIGKEFHVSPFMPMEQDYRWNFTEPGDRLGVHMESYENGERLFRATLALEREEITGASLARALLRHPFMTGKVAAGIYWQAARLWLKRVPFHTHPAKRAS